MSESCCPRCGGAFECGAMGPGPCACQGVTLTPELQAQLRQQFSGCLCLGCLRALAEASAAGPGPQGPDPSGMPKAV